MTSIDRTAYPRFARRLSEEELEERYDLTPAEGRFLASNARTGSAYLTLAVMLKTRQQLGYFPACSEVPDQVRRHLVDRLGLPEETPLLDEVRQKKGLHLCRQRIRAKLESVSFAATGRAEIRARVRDAAHIMSDPADLINVAVEVLSKSNTELPAFSTLDRLIGNIRQQVHEEMYARITSDLDSGQCSALDALLVVPEGERITEFARLKETPGPATLTHVRNWTERLTDLEAILDPRPFIENIPHTKIRQFAAEAAALEVGDLRDVCQPGKRYTLLLCFLHETRTSTRDELIEMFLRRMRKTRKAAREELQELQEKHRAIEENLLGVFGQVLLRASNASDDETLGTQVRQALEAQGGVDVLGAQFQAVSAYHNNNYLPLLWRVHKNSRAVLFRVIDLLAVKSTTQDTALLEALDLVSQNRNSRRNYLPLDLDIAFLSEQWRNFVTTRDDGCIGLDRRSFEVAVFIHAAQALESGDLHVVGSSAYADYRTQLLSWTDCQERLPGYCDAVGLPGSGSDLVNKLKTELSRLCSAVDATFPNNSELTIDADGTPHLKRLKARQTPEDLQAFAALVQARMPERHLLDVLRNVHHWSAYTRHFGPSSGSDNKLSDATRRYLIAVFGYGCNLGPSQTARHAPEAINRHTMRRINAQHVTALKLEAAANDIIEEYIRFGLPQFWGEGKAAIADGTQMELRENNLLGSRHIRYDGFGGIAYHHISDNYIAVFSNFIACGVWEAVYILDGLLLNASRLQPDTVHADTHGQSEPVFGLACLLGINLFPRMRNWNDVIFYRPSQQSRYKHIDALFGGVIDWALIEAHYRDMMQVILSIQAGTVLPSMLLRKLGSHNRKNRLSKAFRELGRVVRTLFLLRYISEVEFRQTIRAETTKIESYNAFLDWIGFGGSVIKSGDPVEQNKQIKYMNLVANAIMLHNVVDLTDILESLVADGYPITRKHVAGLSPYTREHIRRFGWYFLEMEQLPEPLKPRSLQLAA